MTSNFTTLASGTTGTAFSDVGAAGSDVRLYTYVVSRLADKPTLNIQLPCDSPPSGPICNSNTSNGTADVTGSTSGLLVYVNGYKVSSSFGSFTSRNIPLFLGLNSITAAVKSPADAWNVDQIQITRDNGNQPPHIDIAILDRGQSAIPANNSVIYDPTPEIEINYNDPDGIIDPTRLAVFINGTDRTSAFMPRTTSRATYQVLQAWNPGSNFVSASIRDGTGVISGYGASASAHVELSNPVIESFSVKFAHVGDSIAISGNGFDPLTINNMVWFPGVSAAVMPSAASRTVLDVAVPAGAHSGEVTVVVDSRTSSPMLLPITTEVARSDHLLVDANRANHVFVTDASVGLEEVLDDGTVVLRCSRPRASGLAVDSGGSLYFGDAYSLGTGPVYSYPAGGGQCLIHAASTVMTGEMSAGVSCLASDGASIYTVDGMNYKIKRIDPSGVVSAITSGGQPIGSGCGITTDASGSTLYFVYGFNSDEIRKIPSAAEPQPNPGKRTL